MRLGTRMAEPRKSQDITQVEMAKTLGVSQQTINSCEVDHRRIPVSALVTLARAQQRFVMQVIDTVLARQDR